MSRDAIPPVPEAHRESALAWLEEASEQRLQTDGVRSTAEDKVGAAQVHALIYVGDQLRRLAEPTAIPAPTQVKPEPGIMDSIRIAYYRELEKEQARRVGDELKLLLPGDVVGTFEICTAHTGGDERGGYTLRRVD